MSEELTFTLNNPLTEEEWDLINDVDFDHTNEITFHTKHGKDVVFGKRKTEHWIPCSERLPEEDGQYIITVKYKHVDGYDDIYAEHGEWSDGKWDMFCFGHCGEVESITAWMPLPEPYKGDEHDDS